MHVREYRILSPVSFIIRDVPDNRERLLFHIKTGDYFAMLATALGFVEETLTSTKEDTEGEATFSRELALLRDMKKDLLFLNTRYDIHEKIKEETKKIMSG